MRTIRHALSCAASAIVLSAAMPLWAQPAVTMPGVFGQAFATADEVTAAAGRVTYQVDCPAERTGEQVWMKVAVHATASNPISVADNPSVLNSILMESIHQAYVQCPTSMFGNMQDRTIGHADILAPAPGSEDPTPIVEADEFGMFGWQHVTTMGAQEARSQPVQQTAPAAPPPPPRVQPQQQSVDPFLAQNPGVAEVLNDPIGSQLRFIGNILKLGFFAALTIWMFVKRESILEWVYALTPHPASDMVLGSLERNGHLDGREFADLMRPVPGNPIEQRVRARQARDLAAKARAAAEERLAELRREKDKAVREAAFVRAQEDLRSAVEAHELAKARLDALNEWRKRNVG